LPRQVTATLCRALGQLDITADPRNKSYPCETFATHLSIGIKQDDLLPITEADLAAVGLKKTDFIPNLIRGALETAKNLGKGEVLYGVPLDVHTVVIYYNKDSLKKAKLTRSGRKTHFRHRH
jgi:hypothetical protein